MTKYNEVEDFFKENNNFKNSSLKLNDINCDSDEIFFQIKDKDKEINNDKDKLISLSKGEENSVSNILLSDQLRFKNKLDLDTKKILNENKSNSLCYDNRKSNLEINNDEEISLHSERKKITSNLIMDLDETIFKNIVLPTCMNLNENSIVINNNSMLRTNNFSISKTEMNFLCNKKSNIYTLSLASQSKNNFERFLSNNETNYTDLKKINIVLVDDESMIINSYKRIISNLILEYSYPIKITLIEANDGFECLLAVYLANKNNNSIDIIISDETMPFFSGNYTAKTLQYLKEIGNITNNLKMYIVSAISQNMALNNGYPNIVNKVFPKPLTKNSLIEILNNL